MTLPPLRRADDDGGVPTDYVGRIVKALDAGDANALAELVGGLHEADAARSSRRSMRRSGALIALLGANFVFTALT